MLLSVAAPPTFAEDGAGLRDRLRSLTEPGVAVDAVPTPYRENIRADLAMIGAQSEALFGPHRDMVGVGKGTAAIALFVAPDCPACQTALDALQTLVTDMGLRASIIDTSDPADAALMEQLTLDTVPSYVMPDRLIRGAFPAFVLEGYLNGSRR